MYISYTFFKVCPLQNWNLEDSSRDLVQELLISWEMSNFWTRRSVRRVNCRYPHEHQQKLTLSDCYLPGKSKHNNDTWILISVDIPVCLFDIHKRLYNTCTCIMWNVQCAMWCIINLLLSVHQLSVIYKMFIWCIFWWENGLIDWNILQ